MKPFIVSMLMVLGLICAANAELYKWVDENGVKHFSNTPPSDSEEVESAIETKNESSDVESSGKIDEALKNYRQDNMQQRLNDAGKYKSKTPKASKDLADYYEHRMKQNEQTLQERRRDLQDVRRESYSDPDYHKRKVERYEERLKRAEIESEYSKKKYYDNR
ncbi:MAG: DUF4124 domain-containing protein [Victivallales bacterium]